MHQCVFIGYSSTEKGICSHLLTRKFFMFVDVTLVEKERYFNQLYLQWKTSLMEDKDKYLFLLLELDSHSSPSPINIKNPLALTHVDSQSSINLCTPNSKLLGQDKPIQIFTHSILAYSKREVPIIQHYASPRIGTTPW